MGLRISQSPFVLRSPTTKKFSPLKNYIDAACRSLDELALALSPKNSDYNRRRTVESVSKVYWDYLLPGYEHHLGINNSTGQTPENQKPDHVQFAVFVYAMKMIESIISKEE